jgi:hypothetical protein
LNTKEILMRRRIDSWTDTLVALGLKRILARKRSPRLPKARPLRLEALEYRYVMTTPAVGSFMRHEINSGATTDLSGSVNNSVIAVEGIEQDTDSDDKTDPDDMLFRVFVDEDADEGQSHAHAFVKSAGWVPAPFWDPVTSPVTVSVPYTSMEVVQLAVAEQSQPSGYATATTNGSAGIVTKFEYVDPTPTISTDQMFYGGISIPVIGLGLGEGDETAWGAWHGVQGTITQNGHPIADVSISATSGNDNGNLNPGVTQYIATIGVVGQDPYTVVASGHNIYINVITPIAHGDDFEFNSYLGTTSGSSIASANHATSSSQALYNFAHSVTVYGFAYDAGSPPPLPDLVTETTGPGLFASGGSAPGDLDGDGSLGDGDVTAWINVIDAAADNEVLPLIVTTEEDVDDGDYSFHDLSLREALILADTADYPGVDTIVFAKWVNEIVLSGSDLDIDIDNDVKIVGPGTDALTIDGDGLSRVFNIGSGVEATIRGLTITGGNGSGGDGGGIYNAGDLTLDQVVVTGNEAVNSGGGLYSTGGSLAITNSTFDLNTAKWGAGVYAASSDALGISIVNSTISDNDAIIGYTSGVPWAGSGTGGGLYVGSTGSSIPVLVVNTTISNNWAEHQAAGVAVDFTVSATVEIRNATVAENHADNAGGGISRYAGTVLLHNSIVAENTQGTSTVSDSDIHYGNVHTNSSYNLIGAGWWGTAPTGAGNQINTDPLLAPLGDYGGKTRTHALLSGSPAIDKGSDSIAGSFDQRGVARSYDHPGVSAGSGGDSDIGAFETGDGMVLTVRYEDDRNNSPSADTLSLREALALAATFHGKETIKIDSSLYASAPWTLTLLHDELVVTDGITIAGPGADKAIIDADEQSRVFSTTGEVALSGLTITGGETLGSGGGVYNDDGNLTLRAVRITDNYADAGGGGIASSVSSSGGGLHVFDSEISENYSGYNGGGVEFLDLATDANFEIVNSTISANTATEFGGGLFFDQPYATSGFARIINATIADNNSYFSYGGAWIDSNDSVTVANSIIAANTQNYGGEMGSASLSASNNLFGYDPNNWYGGSSTVVDLADIGLEQLALNGAQTRTHRLLTGSAAIDAGDDAVATTYDLAFDQRGRDRIDDGDLVPGKQIDIGAFELAFDEFFV